MYQDFLEKSIDNLKGLNKLNLKKIFFLKKELKIYTYEDLLLFYPKTYIHYSIKNISELKKNTNDKIQILGNITQYKKIQSKNKKEILIARFEDSTGFIELIWFQKINFFLKNIEINKPIIVIGKIKRFKEKIQIFHPNFKKFKNNYSSIYPIYHIPKKIQQYGINNCFIEKILKNLIEESKNIEFKDFFRKKNLFIKQLMTKKEALKQIHFPKSLKDLSNARYRLKFEELFFLQLSILYKKNNQKISIGYPFLKLGKNFYNFYKYFLPFTLTDEQKKVFKEIYQDLKKPIQMNRLLQGDVGSGKTIIAILTMLVASDNGMQSCLMVPTEVLAIQHYFSIKKMFLNFNEIKIELLTSSTSNKKKKNIYNNIKIGKISILIGTHSLIQENLKFKNLGLAIIDEQQKFGVIQRSKIWKKNKIPPHILIMTATPIPRTLAMTFYNNLKMSIIKELPLNRKPIKTIHFYKKNKFKIIEIIKNKILKNQQIYIIYPTIESKKNKYQNLVTGYQFFKKKLKKWENNIGVLHGKMTYKEKENKMNQFLKGDIKIMISTTVIEVGIDVPNASIIVIENAEYFGLSQLHQLRGRVGRGEHQSYCYLITNNFMSPENFFKINVMCSTNNGLEIAKKDLNLRGSGDLTGTKQSGKNYLRIANFIKDYQLLKKVIPIAKNFFYKNPNFLFNHKKIKNFFLEKIS
ncbi:ATP-dependent DNA helicase RecG [Blattabacterium cuenoti]|uniref:ATP-dependent DNA helicase RecG n=1 Tax=Blattabacterium cuenoti TaxID=1653831 RepID=UPI00163C8205|nr:ATP-dependent DNA helicase RecG [Blattabacterium cuenoti]